MSLAGENSASLLRTKPIEERWKEKGYEIEEVYVNTLSLLQSYVAVQDAGHLNIRCSPPLKLRNASIQRLAAWHSITGVLSAMESKRLLKRRSITSCQPLIQKQGGNPGTPLSPDYFVTKTTCKPSVRLAMLLKLKKKGREPNDDH